MEKLSRNGPCYCGSGHKYKKCCMLKDNKTMQDEKTKPKNTFREEIDAELKAKPVLEAELVRRDQRVMLLELECRARMALTDEAHIMVGISELRVHRIEIANQPVCETKASALEGIDKQIEVLEGQAERCKVSRVTKLTIDALRVVFADESAGLGSKLETTVMKDDDDGDTGLPPPPPGPENQEGDKKS